MCRIKAKTTRTVLSKNEVAQYSKIFYDAVVLIGTHGTSQSRRPAKVVGYTIAGVNYYVTTDRHDLSAKQVAVVYRLRWDIETFFKWWKKHLKVYHLIAHSKYGLMVQIPGGLILYLLMAIYYQEHFNETVSIKRIRQLRIAIQNELRTNIAITNSEHEFVKEHKKRGQVHAKT